MLKFSGNIFAYYTYMCTTVCTYFISDATISSRHFTHSLLTLELLFSQWLLRIYFAFDFFQLKTKKYDWNTCTAAALVYWRSNLCVEDLFAHQNWVRTQNETDRLAQVNACVCFRLAERLVRWSFVVLLMWQTLCMRACIYWCVCVRVSVPVWMCGSSFYANRPVWIKIHFIHYKA